jgi:predicted dinucleotide-binding enzyme
MFGKIIYGLSFNWKRSNYNFMTKKTKKLKVGILGSGSAGQTLGKGFIKLGHDVVIGTREPSKLNDWKLAAGPKAGAKSPDEAVRQGEIVIISVLGSAAETAIRNAGVDNFAGKIVIDASDPLDFSSGKPGLFVGTTDSLGERIQRLLSDAKVVKAFNTVVADVMIDPSLSGGEPDMFIAGNDHEAKSVVSGLLNDFGWPVIDMGGIESARWLEAISLAWVVYSHRTGKVNHAFKLVGK